MTSMSIDKENAETAERVVRSVGETTSVVVNRRSVEVRGREMNHAQLVGIAYPEIPLSGTREVTVVYSRGPGARPQGFVAPGEVITVVEKQEFHVAVAEHS